MGTEKKGTAISENEDQAVAELIRSIKHTMRDQDSINQSFNAGFPRTSQGCSSQKYWVSLKVPD